MTVLSRSATSGLKLDDDKNGPGAFSKSEWKMPIRVLGASVQPCSRMAQSINAPGLAPQSEVTLSDGVRKVQYEWRDGSCRQDGRAVR